MTLDISISRTWRWTNQSLTAFLEITNLTNRNNIGGIEFDVEEIEDDEEEVLGYALTPEPEHLFPLAPSIGIRWQF